MDLPRRLSMLDATTVVVGTMIGTGIFLRASAIAQLLPDPWLCVSVWVVAGMLSLFGALTAAELGAMYPHAGGLYVYLREAYGPVVAYLFGWSLLAVMQTGSIAGIAAGVTQNLSKLVTLTPAQGFGLEVAMIAGLTFLNVLSVRAGAGVQNLFTAAKCAGILLLIGGGFLFSHGSLANMQGAALLPVGLMGAYGVCMMKALWAYDGWINATFVAGEVKSPERSLPRALLLGTGSVTVIYVAVNAAYHYGLPLATLQAAKAPAVELALVIGGAAGATAMTVLAVVSTFGALNSSILSGPRVYYAMARDGLFFGALGSVHSALLTPHVALLVQGVWATGLLLLWGTFERITDNVMFIYWIFYALGGGALFVLRSRRPGAQRPYRVPGYPVVPATFLLIAGWLTLNTVAQSPVESAQALGLLGLGLFLYPWVRQKAP